MIKTPRSIPWRWLLSQIAITIALLLVVELALRATLFHCEMPEPNLCQFGTVDYHANSIAGGGDLTPSQDGVWAVWPHRPYHVQTNSDGLRNAEEVSPNADLRILAVGDSLTFGPYVPNEETWPGWLENTLRTDLYPARAVQVLNAGVAGYTIQDEYYYLAERGALLKPDLVILAFFPNDISDFSPVQRDYLNRQQQQIVPLTNAQSLKTTLARVADNIAILKFANRSRRNAILAEAQHRRQAVATDTEACDPFREADTPELRQCWDQYEEWLRSTILLLNDNNIPLLIVAIPDYHQFPEDGYPTIAQEFVGKIAAAEKIPFLDLLPGLREHGAVDALYLVQFDPVTGAYNGNGHMSSYGYRAVALLITDQLAELGYLNK